MRNIKIKGGNPNAQINIQQREEHGIWYIDFDMEMPTPEIPEEVMLIFSTPNLKAYSVFRHTFDGELRNLLPHWRPRKNESRFAYGVPLQAHISARGENFMNVAVSDCRTPITISSGCFEGSLTNTEDVPGNWEVKVTFFTKPIAAIQHYSATIRVDFREIPYYDSIYDTVTWWEKECGYTPAFVPKTARDPVNSMWYSYHQEIDVDKMLEECKEGKAWGLDTLILDDGWQTDDKNRGYAYCGDWEIAKAKVPDMKAFVERVHDLDMRFMLWFSVPYIGRYSKAFERFQDMLLDKADFENAKVFCIDPRYKEARDYLKNIYVSAVRDWKLDGLKLDFIDSFVLYGKSLEADERRDYTSLEDALDALMKEVYDELREINPDIMLEFRQNYMGPAVRQYGNMIRVGDCPADALKNRYEIINLRLLCGNTPIHSDMIMWDYEQSVEVAATQLTNIMFSVPQVSLLADRLSEEHKKMIRFYIGFWKDHRKILLDGKLIANNPESSYSSATSFLGDKAVGVVYSDSVVDGGYSYIATVNSSRNDYIYLKNASGKTYSVYNCMGEKISSGAITSDIQKIEVPFSGVVIVA